MTYCTVFAGDSLFNSSRLNLSINVSQVNDNPTFNKTIGNFSIAFNQSFLINLSEYFFDVDNDILTYFVSFPSGLNATFNGEIANVSPIPDTFTGQGSMGFAVNDTSFANATSNIFFVTVNDNFAPVFLGAQVNITEDSGINVFNLTPFASDVENNPIIFSLLEENVIQIYNTNQEKIKRLYDVLY